MFEDTIKTNKQLWNFIAKEFGIKLPYTKVAPDHSTPFEFISDAYFHRNRDVAAWANRRGGKTIAASIIAALDFYQRRGPIRGSEDQARTLYEYWTKWCDRLLYDQVLGAPTKLVTRLSNGDFEILASSSRAVRGPAIQRLFWDEVDEIDQQVMDASVGTLNTLAHVHSRTVATSTWHRTHGPMGRYVARAKDSGIRVHKWNIWEIIEPCPLERHRHGRGCKRCPLEDVCMGAALNVNPMTKVGIAATRRCGLFAIDDAIRQYRSWSADQWNAEAECQRPVTAGLVYPRFNPVRHVDSGLDFQDDLPIYRTIDWGLNDFVCLWIQKDKRGTVYVVDEHWTRQATVPTVAKEIREKDKHLRIEETYCDPAGRNRNDQTGWSDVDMFKRHGIHCDYNRQPWARDVVTGINKVRTALAPAFGPPRLKIAGRCRNLIKAFDNYRLREVNGLYIDEPIKPQECDHFMDALRYFFVNSEAQHDEQRQLGWAH
jgi:hypothetical protein